LLLSGIFSILLNSYLTKNKMIKKLIISTAQINFTVGDLIGNKGKILAAHAEAHADGADIVIFSEMSITGYPPEDLVLLPDFQEKSIQIIRELAEHTANKTAMLVGSLWQEADKIYNAAILLDAGEIKNVICKSSLPNYGVFDEKRVFSAAPMPEAVNFRGAKLGVMICEDMWNLETAKHLKKQGAEILISINASPFEDAKHDIRMDFAQKNAAGSGLPLMYVNQVGGQDELVFEGGSFILNKLGQVVCTQEKWQESLLITNWKKQGVEWVCAEEVVQWAESDRFFDIYNAMKIGLSDYINKNNFCGVVIGMSGGIDSALTAAIAADSLGSDRVRLVMMPSKYTSKQSLDDAEECSKLLGIRLEYVPIEKAVFAFEEMLSEVFKGKKPDLTEENLQARIRGNILMAISNKFGHMVLTTGNKSEMAVGYATLYGDMCGGYNILKDTYKTDVFALAKWRNKQSFVIPENIITKAPTAELRPNQKDEDSLPPYHILDDILMRLIELRHSPAQIAEHGYPIELVDKVARLVKISEYKRRQAAIGVKITGVGFGKDRRYPITNCF
jgi:NAD+ synthase